MELKQEVTLNITPEKMAAQYVRWGSDQQGRFLNLVGKAFKDANYDAETQVCYLVDDVNKDGRDFVYTVANFLKVRGIPCGSPKEDTLINSYPCGGI